MTESIEELERRLTCYFQSSKVPWRMTHEFAASLERMVNSYRAAIKEPLVQVCSTPEQLKSGVKFKLKS
jgi:hypothetical protein